jgi:hypothetical protein
MATSARFVSTREPENTGTHIGSLWTASGTQLATATFTNETASGWQQVDFASPVAITANTTYVASYLAPNGHYAGDNGFFSAAGVDSPPLHALKDGTSGGNGVFTYSGSTTFPVSTFQATNYWVDVVFTTTAPQDTTPPTVTAISPASGATGVAPTTTVTATFSEAMNASTITTSTFVLRDSSNVVVPAAVTYNATTFVATLTPNAALAQGVTYTATISGGASGVKDSAGNAMAANKVWSFTTIDTTAPTITAVSPASGATNVSTSATVTARSARR